LAQVCSSNFVVLPSTMSDAHLLEAQHSDHLRPSGHSSKEIAAKEEALWEKFKDDPAPHMWPHLSLAEDGGFSEVKDLYYHGRWVTAAILLIFVVYNVVYLVMLDTSFISDPYQAIATLSGLSAESAKNSSIMTSFYFTEGIIDRMVVIVTGNETITVAPVQVLGCLELANLAYWFLKIFLGVFWVLTDTGFKKWWWGQYIFWEALPVLSSFSSMKLLNYIVPAVFFTHLFERIGEIQEAIEENKRIAKVFGVLHFIIWILTVILGFMVGFDTFLMKMRVVALKASAKTMSTAVVLPCMQFLVQVLGVVQLGPFVRKRLFVFVFGGEDGIMQDEELELMDTWNALLARRMYEDLGGHKYLAVMLSFSDEDFQSLVFNENKEVKESTIGT